MRYALIRKMDISNGIGIGVSLFVQGCHFHCHGCFNQETWNFGGGNPWTSEVEDQFIKLASQPHIVRVSILGGEPFEVQNAGVIAGVIKRIKSLGLKRTIWVYSGFKFEKLTELAESDEGIRSLLEQADVLVDGQFQSALQDLTLPYRGSSNQRIIDMNATRDVGEIKLLSI